MKTPVLKKDRGNVAGTSLGIEAIAEFQTLTSTYGAQYGGNGGAINAVTKSGTNDLDAAPARPGWNATTHCMEHIT